MQTAKRLVAGAAISLAGVLTQTAAMACTQGAHMHSHAPLILASAVADKTKLHATKAALRDLWIGHVFWVRNVVVAGLAG